MHSDLNYRYHFIPTAHTLAHIHQAWHCALYDKYPNEFKVLQTHSSSSFFFLPPSPLRRGSQSQFRNFMSMYFGITRTADEATQQPESEVIAAVAVAVISVVTSFKSV